jgi:hypothetical protein
MGKIYYILYVEDVKEPIEIDNDRDLIQYVKKLIMDKDYYPYFAETHINIGYGENDISLEIKMYFVKWKGS